VAGLDAVGDLASEAESPERWVTYSEEFRRVRDGMGRLPAEQREVVTLHLYGDMTFREIAECQQASVKTVQSRYRYGLDKLRAAVDGEVAE
jgi:RNA polymerase sigma-70 factor (ECF subfamily)